MRRIPMATALRIYCAERTRAMQLVCMCASNTCARFSQNACVRNDMGTSVVYQTVNCQLFYRYFISAIIKLQTPAYINRS